MFGLRDLAAANPFSAEPDPRRVHAIVLPHPPTTEALVVIAARQEAAAVKGGSDSVTSLGPSESVTAAFSSCRLRVLQHAHHAERLAEVQAACATPQTATSIVPLLFKRALDLHQTTFALGESFGELRAALGLGVG